jgi:hypothetical protein
MLQAFHMDIAKVDLDVAYVLQWLHTCFKCFHVFCKCFKYMFASVLVFGRMLQVFHLNVAKVNLVLHMLQWNPPTATIRAATGAPPCVIVRAREASRHIRGMHPQVGQELGPTWAQTAWEA